MSYYTVLSKNLKISYDWRGMPVEFRMESRSGNVLENTHGCSKKQGRTFNGATL